MYIDFTFCSIKSVIWRLYVKKFAKYVSQNMLGMVGMSVYILADTFLFPNPSEQMA